MGMKRLAALVMALVLCLAAVGALAAESESEIYKIETLAQLKAFRDKVNGGDNFEGDTVELGADIDLNNEEWTPIGSSEYPFNGIFDGQGHTISNLKITSGKSYVGLFGRTNSGEVKNLTVHNALVTGRLGVGVVSGCPYTSAYTNIKVTGHVEVNGMSYIGGVLGRNLYADATNITVDVDGSSYVRAVSTENGTAYRTYVGGVIGFMGEGSHTVKNVTSNIDVYGDVCDIGGITGIAHYGNAFINCKVVGDIVYEGDDAENAVEIGGIAGTWHNQANQTVAFDGCAFEGTLEGLPEDTVVHNGGLIGAPYNSSKYESGEGTGSLKVNGETFENQTQQDEKAPEMKPTKVEETPKAATKTELVFTYLEGDNYSGQAGGLAFKSSAEFNASFAMARVLDSNEKVVGKFEANDPEDAESAVFVSGSIKVTLTQDYLDTLEDGTYTIEIYANKNDVSNMASGSFMVTRAAASVTPPAEAPGTEAPQTVDLPQTGDDSSIALWAVLAVLCAGAFAVLRKRARFN